MEDDPEQGSVYLDISDNGGGIPDDILDKVLEPFFTTKDTGQGAGLGLSTSHGIVTGCGGSIRISNVEDGALISVMVPRLQDGVMPNGQDFSQSEGPEANEQG